MGNGRYEFVALLSMAPEMDEKELAYLVVCAQRGDRRALENVCKELQGQIRGSLLKVFPDVHLANDLAQEAYLRLIQGFPNIREPTKIRAFVSRIVLFTVNDYLRSPVKNQSRHRVALQELEQYNSEAHQEERILGKIFLEKLLRIVPKPIDKQLIVMRLSGMKFKDISQELLITEENAKKRFQRIISFARKQI